MPFFIKEGHLLIHPLLKREGEFIEEKPVYV